MFINCPFCKALIATDPASDLPPDHCPRCAAKLRGIQDDGPAPAAPLEDAGTVVSPLDPAFLLEVPPPEMPTPDGGRGATPWELSSQIQQIVAEASRATGSATPAIAPIAAMLKHVDAEATPAGAHDAADRESAVAPTPVPAAGSAPASETRAATSPATDTGAAKADTTGEAVLTGADAAPAQAGAAGTPVADRAADAATAAGQAPLASAPAAMAVAERAPAATPATRALPSFARRHARLGVSGLHWKSLVPIAALALLLVLQLLLADREVLASDARWRPLLSNLCGVFGCTLPPWREPAAFTVLARGVRPHPSTPGALRVTATFRNDARWPQPWPQVRLTLSDVNGNAVAARDFNARDYLGAVPAQVELRSGQSASIAIDVVEPEPRSVAFDFELH